MAYVSVAVCSMVSRAFVGSGDRVVAVPAGGKRTTTLLLRGSSVRAGPGSPALEKEVPDARERPDDCTCRTAGGWDCRRREGASLCAIGSPAGGMSERGGTLSDTRSAGKSLRTRGISEKPGRNGPTRLTGDGCDPDENDVGRYATKSGPAYGGRWLIP